MKKIIVFFILLPSFLFAQEKGTFDYNIGAGVFNTNFLIDVTSHVLTEVVTLGGVENSRAVLRTPAFNATFKYAVGNNWFVNADGVCEFAKYDLLDKNDVVVGQEICSYYNIGVGTEYHYLNEKIIQLYSGGAVGYTFRTSRVKDTIKNNAHFNFQMNLIGVRIGKKFAGTFELGAGYKGLVNIGLSYQP